MCASVKEWSVGGRLGLTWLGLADHREERKFGSARTYGANAVCIAVVVAQSKYLGGDIDYDYHSVYTHTIINGPAAIHVLDPKTR